MSTDVMLMTPPRDYEHLPALRREIGVRLPYPLGREKEGYAFLLTVLRSSWVCSRSS